MTRAARGLLAVTAGGILIWRLVATKRFLDDIASITTVPPIAYNDAVQASIDVLMEQSTSWSQVTLVLLGALAALWIAKADEVRLVLKRHYCPEIIMWIAGVSLLITSVYCHKEYIEGVAGALEAGGRTSSGLTIANVWDDKFDALRREQFRLLVFGTSAAALALFSLSNLAGGSNAKVPQK